MRDGLRSATALILAGLDRDGVIRGLRLELDLTTEEAEAAWEVANERLGNPTDQPRDGQ
jgi:hypothetical protein